MNKTYTKKILIYSILETLLKGGALEERGTY